MKSKELAPLIVFNFNLLFFRYVVFDLDDELIEGIIPQWPWWNTQQAFESALFRHNFWRWT